MTTELTAEEFNALIAEAMANFPSVLSPDERLDELTTPIGTPLRSEAERSATGHLIIYNLKYNWPVWLWLRHYQNSDVQAQSPDELLNLAVEIPGDEGYHAVLRAVVCEFISRFLTELREIICTKHAGRIGKASNVSAKGTVVAISTWIASTVGIQSPQALALATMVLWVCGSALHGAFCKMTDGQITNALESPPEAKELRRLRAQFAPQSLEEPDHPQKGRAPKGRGTKPSRATTKRS